MMGHLLARPALCYIVMCSRFPSWKIINERKEWENSKWTLWSIRVPKSFDNGFSVPEAGMGARKKQEMDFLKYSKYNPSSVALIPGLTTREIHVDVLYVSETINPNIAIFNLKYICLTVLFCKPIYLRRIQYHLKWSAWNRNTTSI